MKTDHLRNKLGEDFLAYYVLNIIKYYEKIDRCFERMRNQKNNSVIEIACIVNKLSSCLDEYELFCNRHISFDPLSGKDIIELHAPNWYATYCDLKHYFLVVNRLHLRLPLPKMQKTQIAIEQALLLKELDVEVVIEYMSGKMSNNLKENMATLVQVLNDENFINAYDKIDYFKKLTKKEVMNAGKRNELRVIIKLFTQSYPNWYLGNNSNRVSLKMNDGGYLFTQHYKEKGLWREFAQIRLTDDEISAINKYLETGKGTFRTAYNAQQLGVMLSPEHPNSPADFLFINPDESGETYSASIKSNDNASVSYTNNPFSLAFIGEGYNSLEDAMKNAKSVIAGLHLNFLNGINYRGGRTLGQPLLLGNDSRMLNTSSGIFGSIISIYPMQMPECLIRKSSSNVYVSQPRGYALKSINKLAQTYGGDALGKLEFTRTVGRSGSYSSPPFVRGMISLSGIEEELNILSAKQLLETGASTVLDGRFNGLNEQGLSADELLVTSNNGNPVLRFTRDMNIESNANACLALIDRMSLGTVARRNSSSPFCSVNVIRLLVAGKFIYHVLMVVPHSLRGNKII